MSNNARDGLPMFNPGDKVVHTRHGAGTVIEKRTLVYDGKEREYFCIKMNDDRRTLMIPIESIDEDEIRPAMVDLTLVERILNEPPSELADNYRTRQANIREKLRSRNPHKLASALRDLSWQERTHKLTNTDTRLRDQLIKALAREIALKPSISVAQARSHIQHIIEDAMKQHEDTTPDSDSVAAV